MIIYFTGTGNSKYIASVLAKQLNDELIDASAFIKENTYPSLSSNKPYVFVSPVYAWRMPKIFEEFIRKCSFNKTTNEAKAYAVLTCGSEIGAADTYVEKLCTDMNFEYMGTAEVIMPENYLVMFTPTPESEDNEIISNATKRALKLSEKISAEISFDKNKHSALDNIYSVTVNPLFYTFSVSAKKFYVTDACISCGKCVKNCILNNITLKDGKPVWGKNCTHCMACICKCPTEAIEYGKKTKGRRRYVYKNNDSKE